MLDRDDSDQPSSMQDPEDIPKSAAGENDNDEHDDAEESTAYYTFPTPFDWNARDPVTLHELRMRAFGAMVLEKPRWWEKVFDDALVAKWRREMQEYDRLAIGRLEGKSVEWGLSHPNELRAAVPDFPIPDDASDHDDDDEDRRQRWPRDPVTDAQLDWTFAFLKHAAGERDQATGCQTATIPCVYEAGSLVPKELNVSLVHQAGILESVPEEEKDWHPGSDGQVLDLVHPSLYCVRIERTQVLRSDEDVARVADPVMECTFQQYLVNRTDLDIVDFISHDFQWLPTDFEISSSGSMKALGYINNLHPIKHRPLCSTITSVLQRFVPLFEKSLSDVLSPAPPLVINPDPSEWYSHLPDEPDEHEDYSEWRYNRKPHIPNPAPFQPPSSENRIKLNLKGRTVQVIVKLANIVLTPDKPRYPGGSWHVEGMANERIVATGLYYYACANITESRLAFRTQVGTDPESADMPYENGDSEGWRKAFGFGADDALNQEMGSIVAEEGKCVVFPNIYQHCVQPFELADKTRPGYRKILCFFLVDPFKRILSSSEVPPQQREWYLDEMERAPALQNLPRELYDMIADYVVAATITREVAEEDRKKLMEERRNFVVEHNETVFEVPYNLCEH